jgi:hydroxymethylglutaryl-CoA reductase
MEGENKKEINGFSKFSRRQKLKWLAENFFSENSNLISQLEATRHPDKTIQDKLDRISENTVANFHLPYGVAPNFIINGKTYCLPMVTEESSVVAAASSAAKYWSSRGGFKASIIDTIKIGHIHFTSTAEEETVQSLFAEHNEDILMRCKHLTKNMEKRGGGVIGSELICMSGSKRFYQVRLSFQTCDSMGANFINSVLEEYAKALIMASADDRGFREQIDVTMSILSNFTPECLVRCQVDCEIEELRDSATGLSPGKFAERFKDAVEIANLDTYRAVTHNKGIFNGIDAVAIATGNDFRAIEACGHAYAARTGAYKSLSACWIEANRFFFSLEIPMAVGTVGGLTRVHPLAKRSLEMLQHPGAEDLMMILASVGLAQNFAAVRSLVTTGIQRGHMKMHLPNILNQLKATEHEFKEALVHFKDRLVSHSAVREFIYRMREKT